jgi:hypothetical protein
VVSASTLRLTLELQLLVGEQLHALQQQAQSKDQQQQQQQRGPLEVQASIRNSQTLTVLFRSQAAAAFEAQGRQPAAAEPAVRVAAAARAGLPCVL